MSINKVIIIGNLGQDPEVKQTPNGHSVANFSIAANESYTDKQGQKHERVEWIRVVVWGKLAEVCGKYLSKGRQAYIEGKMQTRQWQDKDGQTRYTTEVVASTIQFLGGGTGSQRTDSDNAGAGDPGYNEQDIPF